MAAALTFIATCPRDLEPALALELKRLGLQRVVEEPGAVRFLGPVKDGYHAAMHSRLASRVLLRLGRLQVSDADTLYDGLSTIPWEDHLHDHFTFAVRFAGTSRRLRDERYSARVVKDAVVDRLRRCRGSRPDVDADPDLRIMVRFRDGSAGVHLDLTGPLHLRGGERRAGEAPLRETLAAALLQHAGWTPRTANERPLLDPFCGSGTILTEAAAIALNRPPGLERQRWPLRAWAAHDVAAWSLVRRAAADQVRADCPTLFGSDIDARLVRTAEGNARRLGLDHVLRFEVADATEREPPTPQEGVIVTNPPYGERLEDHDAVGELYSELGRHIKQHFTGWEAWILSGPKSGIKRIGMRPSEKVMVRNGPLRCNLCHYEVRRPEVI